MTPHLIELLVSIYINQVHSFWHGSGRKISSPENGQGKKDATAVSRKKEELEGIRVPGWDEGIGCQPPVSRDAASRQPELCPTRSAPPRPRPRAAPRSPRPPGLAGLAAHHPRARPELRRSCLGRDEEVQASAPRSPRMALRRTIAAKPAATARRTCRGPKRPRLESLRVPELQPPPLPTQA